MKRLLLLQIALCISTLTLIAASKYSPAIIHTKTGKKIECLAKFPDLKDKKVSYKLSQKSKVEKIPSESIERIAFINEEEDSYGEVVYTAYTFYDILGTREHKPQWLGVMIKGDAAKGEVTLLMYRENPSTFYIICKRPKERIPTYLGAYTLGSFHIANPFFKKAAEYFSDYPELAKKISEKEFKEKEIMDIVTEYNVWKSAR
ncbi:MAG: hypothetical protein LBR52_05410 [Prevotellaceae bacterium]|jgi:hypothetical protein|nr:hypothetical protein [Prevotellaceae bacterium]